MAGNQNSGGYRPTADQNNPMVVKGNGGNGQSGQAAQRYAGMPYGQGKALMQQQQAATMSKPMPSVTAPSGAPTARARQVLPPVTGIMEPTARETEDVMTGLTPYGQPNDPAQLGIMGAQNTDNTQANKTLDSYYPVMNYISSRPSTSAETRQVLSLLMRGRTVL
jgi:hypothetical protein